MQRGMLMATALMVVAVGGWVFGNWFANLPALRTSTATRATATATLTFYEWQSTQACIEGTVQGRELYGYRIFGSPTPRPDITATPRQLGGDPAKGYQVFHEVARCNTCHETTSNDYIVGPSLKRIALTAGLKRAGLSDEDYLRSVILRPDEFITPLTKPGIMPTNYRWTLSQEQLNDLVAYLLTLR